MKNLIYFFAIIFMIKTIPNYAQNSKGSQTQFCISGIVNDQATGNPILFGSVALIQNDKVVKRVETDLEGRYNVCTDSQGIYRIEVGYVGYQKFTSKDIQVNKLSTTLDISLNKGITLDECIIVDYKQPLVSSNLCSSGNIVTAKKIKKLPVKNINAGMNLTSRFNKNRKKKSNHKHQFNSHEEYGHIEENEFINPKDEALSTFSIDVDRAAYSNIRRILNQNNLPPIDAVRIEEMINYFPYNYASPNNEVPFSIAHNLTTCPWNPDHQILHIGIQGVDLDVEDLPANNLVFLIDVSGSMNAPNKLDLVKASLNLLVDKMRKQDKIAIVTYAGAAGLVLKSTSGNKKAIIKEAIQNLSAGGSTAGGQGIELAYRIAKENLLINGNNRVILSTDGDFNVGIRDDGALLRLIEEKREDNIFLSVLGFGTGNYKDNKMQILANSGNGNHAYIDHLSEAKKTLITEFGSTLFTIAKDVKIQIEFNPEFVKKYKLIGYENRILDKQDFNNDKKDAGDLGAGHSVTAFYEIIPQTKIARSKKEVDRLKYQTLSSTENQSDFATIKLRYKKPKKTKSQLIEEIISPTLVESLSSDIQFALCVAEFGLLLRNSDAAKESNLTKLLIKSKDLTTEDHEGYRTEFFSLVEKAASIQMNEID